MPLLSDKENEIFGLLSEKRQSNLNFSDRETEIFGLLTEKRGTQPEVNAPFEFSPIQPQTQEKRERVYFSDTGKMFDMPTGSSRILQDIHQDDAFDDPSGVFEEVGATFKKQAAFLGLLANAFGFVNDEDIAPFIADRSKALVNSQERAPEYYKKFQREFQEAEGYFEMGAVLMSNPRAIGRLIITQTPNSILPLMTGLTGVGIGTGVGGPIGGLIGFGIGIGGGTAIVEIGAWMDQRMVERGIDMSDAAQVLTVLQDDAFMSEIVAEAKRKGLAQGTVEALFAVFGASLLKRAIPGTSILRKVGRKAGEVGLETVGEGGGEAIGQAVARGVIDIKDVILESISGLGQSATTVGITSAIPGKKAEGKVTPVPEEGVVTEEQKLQRAAEEIKEEAKAEEVTPEIIIETAKKIEVIEKTQADTAQASKETEEALKAIGPTEKTREAVIQGRIEDIDEQIRNVDREIDSLEELKSKADKPSKALQNKIDKKLKARDFLDSSRAELLIAEDRIEAFQEAVKGKIRIKGEKVVRIALKAEESGLRKGIREGLRRGVNNIREAKKKLTDLINATTFSKNAKDNKAIRDRLIKANATRFKDIAQFEKNLPNLNRQITEAFERTQRKELIGDIKSAIAKTKGAKNIAIDLVRQIEALVKDIDLVKRTAKTKGRLQSTLDFIKREIEAGREVQMPKRVITQLELLNKTPIEELTNEDLQSLLDQINTLGEVGRQKLKRRKEIKKLQKESKIKQIKEDARPFVEREERRVKGVRGQLGRVDSVKNAFDRALNVAKRKFIAITPMDVVFDKMSKIGNYKGAIFRIFKGTIDNSTNKYLKQKAVIQDRVLKAKDSLGIKESSYVPIGTWATLQQEGGREKLLASGFTEKELTVFEEEGLTENEEKLFNLMRQELEKLKPFILDVMKRVYNKDFASVKNYFPMMTDFKGMTDFEIKNMFGPDAKLIDAQAFAGAVKKDVEQGFTIDRKGGRNRIKLDAMDIFLKHTDNAIYLINLAQDIRELGELAATNEFNQAAGALGQEVTTEWIDLLARRGGKQGYRVNAFDTFRKNTGWVVLGYKLSSMMIQPTALMDGGALIGRYAFKGAFNVGLDANWRTFLKNNFTELQARIADDPAYAEFMNNKSGTGIIGAVRRGSFWGLRKLDSITASAIAAGAYEKIVTEKGNVVDFANPDADAIQEAQLIMRRSQASGQFKDAPSALTQGTFSGSIRADKLIFQFQSFMLNRWSLVQHDMIHNGIRLGQTKESLNIATWLMLAVITEVAIRRGVEEIIAAATGTGDDLENIEDVLVQKLAMETVRTIPIIGQIVSSLNYGSVPVPIISLTQQAIRRANIAIKTKDDEKRLKNTVLAVSLLAGEIGGIPGTLQIDQIIRKIWKTKAKEIKLPR